VVITNVSLLNFRNFNTLSLNLRENLNIFSGANAQGKTNLLESIYLCATGRSQRTSLLKELIQFGSDSAHIKLTVRAGAANRIDLHLRKNEKKGVAINGVAIKNIGDLFGVLYVVIFSPEDLNLIKSGPADRRRFMDMELCQLSKVYYYEIQQYVKALKQRNNLLKKIESAGGQLRDTLPVWDENLAAHGVKIIEHRKKFIESMSLLAGEKHAAITGGKEKLEIIYKPNVAAEDFAEKLAKNIRRDIQLGSSSIGVHKDDLLFLVNGSDGRVYGSQGQQRTAALSVKLAEIELIKKEKKLLPVLLLDDVMSELDESRQTYLVKKITEVQSLITCTGAEDFLKRAGSANTVFRVINGTIFNEGDRHGS
jgi:DNA replication and repair protein RecF